MASRFALNIQDRENNVPSVQQNGKQETIFIRSKKQAFGEVNKNTIHNQARVNAKPNDKFVIQSKENLTVKDVFADTKTKQIEEDLPFGIFPGPCQKSCHTSIPVIWAENDLKDVDLAKKIEEAKKLDDFAWEKEILFNNIQKGLDEEIASMMDDIHKKFPKQDDLKEMFDDFNDLLVRPSLSDGATPIKSTKPKQSMKFKVFEDDVPDFVPIPKKNKRALALRRL